MTAPKTETTIHRFDASILGKEKRGQKTMLKLDWKLPSSKYELTLYVDDDDADILHIGDRLHWTIRRESLKDGKEGKYPTDYFWGWDKDDSAATRNSPTVYQDDAERSMNEDFAPSNHEDQSGWDKLGNSDGPPPGDPRDGQQRAESPNAGIVVEGVVQGHLEKLAVDLYVRLRAEGWDEGQPVNYTYIREIRDGLYHQVKKQLIRPEHFCYEHSTQMQHGNTGYGHRVAEENAWCIEGQPGLVVDPEETE